MEGVWKFHNYERKVKICSQRHLEEFNRNSVEIVMSQSYIYIAEIVKISLKILEAGNNSSSKIPL